MSFRRRQLSAETAALAALGALFLGAAVWMCASAYRAAGRSSAASGEAPLVQAAPALPPASDVATVGAVFAPAPAPTSIFGPPSTVELAPASAAAPPPSAPSVSSAPTEAFPPPRPIELNAPVAGLGLSSYDRFTAVYDIAAHTVILPDGERLEAHSGLGALKDDPRHVDEKDRGATPPHLYDLALREDLFHGVQALRLNPVGGAGEVFGRVGLLAHTYMLGPKGDSNGCVSFRNYGAFLQAFQSGQIKRLAVVSSLK